MNPVFILLVILIAILLWFLMSFAFKPLGKFFYRLWTDVVNEMKDNEDSK